MEVKAGESKRVTLSFDLSDLSYYDVKDGWTLENGDYEVQICASYSDVRLVEKLNVTEGKAATCPYPAEIAEACEKIAMTDELFERFIGMEVPAPRAVKPYDLESPFGSFLHSFCGKLLFNAVCFFLPKKQKRLALKKPEGPDRDNHLKSAMFLQRTFDRSTPISMCTASNGAMPLKIAELFVDVANGHILKGISRLFTRYNVPPLTGKK